MTDRQLQQAKSAAVSTYTAAGYVLFSTGRGDQLKAPLNPDHCGKCDRHTCPNGGAACPCGERCHWQQTKYEPGLEADDLNDYYAVILTDDMVILDYDPRRDDLKDDADNNQLQQFFREFKIQKPVQTYIVTTGSGGMHIYWRKPKNVHIRSSITKYGAIDFKTSGGYVIAAGSKHYTGTSYISRRGDIALLAECPSQVLDSINLINDSSKTRDVGESDSAEQRRRFRQYCGSTAPAIEAKAGDKRTFVVGCKGKTLGLPEAVTLEIMAEVFNPRCEPPWTLDDLEGKVKNAYSYSQEGQGTDDPVYSFAETSKKAEKIPSSFAGRANTQLKWTLKPDPADPKNKTICESTLNNACARLRLLPDPETEQENPLAGLLRMNMFSKQIEFTRPAFWHSPDEVVPYLRQQDVLAIKEHLIYHPAFALYVSTDLVREACVLVSQDNQYHPVKNFIGSCKWDGKPRLDKWLIDYCGSPDTPYVREVGKNTLIALIARIMKPGCQHDHMLILEGKQGTGKSSVVRVLGGEFYADINIDPRNKDTAAGMMGAWVLEASEMEFLRRSDVSALKRFLSLLTDKVRLSYDHFHSVLPRQCGFIGTVNPTGNGYFSDTTGNRRFWPVPTTDINLPALERDRVQLFAEAYERYKKGEPWHITDVHIKAMAEREQGARGSMDTWQEIISNWIQTATASGRLPEIMNTEMIAYYALNIGPSKLDRTASDRICAAMRANGYEKKQKWVNNLNTKIWEKVNNTVDDIDMSWL